jgi:hypothetical protein
MDAMVQLKTCRSFRIAIAKFDAKGDGMKIITDISKADSASTPDEQN